MPQRNTPERRDMLAARATEQRSRSLAFTPMYRKPAGHVGVWAPAGNRVPMERPKLIPAWMNRRTGEPHDNIKPAARRKANWILRQLRARGIQVANG